MDDPTNSSLQGTAMDTDITEIENTLRRLSATDRVRLIEVIARSLREPEPEPEPDPAPAHSPNKAALEQVLDELANLPSQSPADGFSNRDHDRVLYGDHR
jgi:hypothetical protein